MSTQHTTSTTTGTSALRLTVLAVTAAATLALTGCADMSRKDRNTVLGATAGAVVGGALTGSTTGAAVGAAAGGVIGNETSKRRPN
ncbi:MAG: glycine zipper 2TM domain-containing protein [Burkholderiales bacterium]|jgi:osmotically inducible lipoprotein OsmB|nr:glycine zipper 2TM domain-containing protein [Burkholderiales bacterium]MBW8894417.1 glycine zipper 2TM domain-containing protein [Burkholderiales bacterium]